MISCSFLSFFLQIRQPLLNFFFQGLILYIFGINGQSFRNPNICIKEVPLGKYACSKVIHGFIKFGIQSDSLFIIILTLLVDSYKIVGIT